MYEILRLIRIRTIAFAALTMYAMRYLVIRPMLDINGLALQMTGWAFFLLVVAVCCLISGAYVINDYFDTKSDRISGIKKVVVGKSISRRVAISLHTVLNLFAVSIAFDVKNMAKTRDPRFEATFWDLPWESGKSESCSCWYPESFGSILLLTRNIF